MHAWLYLLLIVGGFVLPTVYTIGAAYCIADWLLWRDTYRLSRRDLVTLLIVGGCWPLYLMVKRAR
jgi:hypothetical protein